MRLGLLRTHAGHGLLASSFAVQSSAGRLCLYPIIHHSGQWWFLVVEMSEKRRYIVQAASLLLACTLDDTIFN